MDIMNESYELHKKLKGKTEVKNKLKIKSMHDLSLVYTPGVASSCEAIKDNPDAAYDLTGKGNTVAIISDGSAVLGLGNIGPLASLPVMEGKAALFKEFAGINAIPIILNTQDTDELVETIYRMSPSFGGINLEDISAPRCFEIERRLKELCNIPVFHDDQHGTAIVCGAALINALKIVKKNMKDIKIIVNGAGSAGIAITHFLMELGARNILVCDKEGILTFDDKNLNSTQIEIAQKTNKQNQRGNLSDAIRNADVFIGVSVGNIVTEAMISSMAKDAIVFPLANPIPEITREKALKAGARIVGNGVSNQPNQINNALVFPGLFKGALEGRIKQITTKIELAAARALAKIIKPEELNENYIIPNIFNKKVAKHISKAVLKVVAK